MTSSPERFPLACPRRRSGGEAHLGELRACLNTINSKFRELYGLSARALFAMEIEFKVTAAGKLAIKQARPWIY